MTDQTTAATDNIQLHQLWVVIVFTELAENLGSIGFRRRNDRIKVFSVNIRRSFLEYFRDDTLVKVGVVLSHHRFTDSEGALIHAVFLGKHIEHIGLAVGNLQEIHRTVTDVAKHCRTLKFTEPFRYRCKALWKHINADYLNMIISPAEVEIYRSMLKQVFLEFLFLPCYLSKRKSGGNKYLCIGDTLTVKLSGYSGKGEDIVILVGELVRRKFLMTNADGIILVIPNEQVVGERRLGIAHNHACGETAVSGFDVAVTVVIPIIL